MESKGMHTQTTTEADMRPGLAVDSSALIRSCGLRPEDPIIDVGGASSSPVAEWLDAGYRDITIVDESSEALEALRRRLGPRAAEVKFVQARVLDFWPHRRYALWHDRGVFHRLVHPDERQVYVEIVQQALRPEGSLVMTTFGPEGPDEYGGAPVARYSAHTLQPELGSQFELAEHSLGVHRPTPDKGQQLLHCRFRRHAPRWQAAHSVRGASAPHPGDAV
jgi:SAM-dependent methyltransferase